MPGSYPVGHFKGKSSFAMDSEAYFSLWVVCFELHAVVLNEHE